MQAQVSNACVKQQQLGFGIDRGALRALGVPGRADFEAVVGGVDVHVGGHAAQRAGVAAADRERQHAALLLQAEAALDLGLHLFRRRHRGVPELPQFAVGGGRSQRIAVRQRQRLQRHMAAGEGERFDRDHGCGTGAMPMRAGVFLKMPVMRPKMADFTAYSLFIGLRAT